MINWIKKHFQGKKSYETNEQWIESLKSPVDGQAVQKLRDILVRGLKPALHRYVNRELDEFVEDVAQDALLRILEKIDTFRGESKFTTWAMKIAVREGLTELRRKRYNDVSLDDLKSKNDNRDFPNSEAAGTPVAPDRAAHESHLMEIMMRMIDEELTEKQQTAINAIMFHDLPISVVAEQMGTNRNALYKLVHDARLKLKHRFEQEGINPGEMLNDE